jgi:sigma-B regulation protein RsbU (phosphoserine phosphatase)
MFATVLYLVLEPASGKIVIGNAGHLPPFVKLARDNAVLELDEGTNLALGVLPDPLFEQVTVDLSPGDSFLLYTDGLVEAKNGLGEEYGFERLHAAVAHAPDEAMLDHLLRDLIHFTGTTTQYDDLTLVAFTYMKQQGVSA